MMPWLKKSIVGLLIGSNAFLLLFGFSSLYSSPYTGLRIAACGNAACVKSVDKGSPAWQKVLPGDRVIDVQNSSIPYLAFSLEPNYMRFQKDRPVYWESQRRLENIVIRGRPVKLLVDRDGQHSEITLIPTAFPLARVFRRTVLVYLVAWTFLGVAYLVLRKKDHEIAFVNFIVGSFVCMTFTSFAPYVFRDISFPYVPFRILAFTTYIGAQAFCYATLHMALIFPSRKNAVLRRPWLIAVPYVLFVLVLVLHFTDFFESSYATTYLSMNICLILFFGSLLHSYLVERNTLFKKQIQWVVFGMVSGITCWLALTSVPIVLGLPYVSKEISVLPTVIYPLCFAFAVTRYRLMDIESIFDYAVVYGFTIIVLEAIEMTFLSFAAPFIVSSDLGLPVVSMIAVLMIVLIYVPVRNRVKDMVERLFKRGNYIIEKEMQKLTISLGLCDNIPALEKFISYVNDLLAPIGVCVISFNPPARPGIVYGNSDLSRRICAQILAGNPERLWGRVSGAGVCVYGYELLEQKVIDPAHHEHNIENSLFIPFLPDTAERDRGFLAVLLKKRGETSYSKKDMALLNAISLNIANIIAAGELRRQRDEMETRFRTEKEYVMKELHDGLGNILSSLTVASQAAHRVFAEDPARAADMVARMNDFSTEAMDFLRTGLLVLDDPNREIGDIIESLRSRFGELFSAFGLDLHIGSADGVIRCRPGAQITMNLLRSIQESLTNIIKHAEAKNVCITFSLVDKNLIVTVRDDGRGFSPASGNGGFGLKNMANRIQRLQGTLEVSSSPGNGTSLRFSVPVQDGV